MIRKNRCVNRTFLQLNFNDLNEFLLLRTEKYLVEINSDRVLHRHKYTQGDREREQEREPIARNVQTHCCLSEKKTFR